MLIYTLKTNTIINKTKVTIVRSSKQVFPGVDVHVSQPILLNVLCDLWGYFWIYSAWIYSDILIFFSANLACLWHCESMPKSEFHCQKMMANRNPPSGVQLVWPAINTPNMNTERKAWKKWKVKIKISLAQLKANNKLKFDGVFLFVVPKKILPIHRWCENLTRTCIILVGR